MKKIFNNRKFWTGMSVILTISSVGLLVRGGVIFPIEEDWLFCYCLEENETGCTECPTGCLLNKINGMNKCVGPKSSPQVDPILSNDCTGTKPTNSVANNGSTYPISAQGSIYTKRRYAEQPTDETCTYHCKEKYHYYIDGRTESCKANACGGSKPDNSTANSSDKPEINNSPWKFQASGTTPCTYHCNDGYEYNNSTKTCDLKETISECFFCQFRTEKIQNILSGGVWNKLMDELDRLFKVDGAEVTIQTIPAGAIMAFDLDECPDGWSPFAVADGRFLMGASSDFLDLGGGGNVAGEINKIKLDSEHLPSHYHYIAYRNIDNVFGTKQDTQRGIIVDYTSHTIPDGVRMGGSDASFYEDATYNIKTSAVGGNDAFDITNAYVKVLYCKKDGATSNNTAKVAPVVAIKNNTDPSSYVELIINGTRYNADLNIKTGETRIINWFKTTTPPYTEIKIEPKNYSQIEVYKGSVKCRIDGNRDHIVDSRGFVGGRKSDNTPYVWNC